MDIQQLRYFSCVYELGNYAHAADRLFISRQALRKSVQRLEQELGQTLFTSEKNKIVPTDAAHHLYSASQSVLKSFAELEQGVAQTHIRKMDTIRFGQSHGANGVFTGQELISFSKYPFGEGDIASNLCIVEGSCSETRKKVLNGEVSYAAIIATSMNESLFDYEVARTGQICIAVREDDPLSRKGHIGIRDLRGRRLITQGPGYDVHDLLASRAQDIGFSLDIGDILSDFHDCLRIVEAGLGVTYVYHAKKYPKVAPNVVCLPMDDPSLSWMYCAIAKKGVGDPFMLRFFAGKEGPFADK